MSTTVGTVLIDVKADTAKLVSGMQKAETTVKKSVDNIKRTIVSMAAAYAGIEGIKAFSSMIQDSIDAADATGKLAQKFGLATEAMSEYQYAATMVGVSSGELNAGLGALIRRLKNFQESGGGAAKDAFNELGISMEYARKNFTSTDKAFFEILKRLEEMPDGYRKTAIAQDIFSKSASGILKLTATELEKLSREARAIGISIPESVAYMSASYNDSLERLDSRIRGIKTSVTFGVIGPMDAASKSIVAFFDESFGSTADKMKYFESVAIETIDSVAYGFGFIKDSITGIKIVITSLEIAFYGAAVVIAGAFEPIRHEINALIEGYNSLADLVGREKIDIRIESSIPDNIEKIKELKKEVIEYTQHIEDGRNVAEELSKRMRKNLANSEEKTGTQRRSNDYAGFDIYDDGKNSKLKQQQEQLIKQQEQTYRDYLAIVGSEYDNWLLDVSDKMRKLAEDGSLSAEQLNAAWSQLNKEYEMNLTIKGLDEVSQKYESLIDAQIELAESGMDWGNSLTDSAQDIANALKSVQKITVAELKYDKESYKLQEKYAKDWIKLESSKIPEKEKLIKQKELEKQFDEDSAKLEQNHINASLSGYSDLAGSMAAYFEAGTTGSIALTAAQATLGIASGYSAITTAWASAPFPANLPAVAAASTAVLPLIAQLGSLGGSGGSGVSAQSMQEKREDSYKQKSDDYKESVKPVTDRLDRQIELLGEIAGFGGSQISASVSKSLEEFNNSSKEYAIKSIGYLSGNNAGSYIDDSDNSIRGRYYYGALNGAKYYDKYRKLFDDDRELYKKIALDAGNAVKFYDYKNANTGSIGEVYNFESRSESTGLKFNDSELESGTNFIKFIMALKKNDSLELFGVSIDEYNKIIDDAQKATHKFSMGIIDSMQSLKDASDSFAESYDKITGTQTYSIAKLNKAFSDVKKVTKGEDLSTYLKENIKNIEAVNSLTREQVELLQSQDPKDLQAQVDLTTKLSDDIKKALKSGALDAVNYKDSIELVSEAMEKSNSNIKSWKDSQKSDLQKLYDQANNITYMQDGKQLHPEIAKTSKELNKLFEHLKGGVDGLTDSEFKFLNANKEIIEKTQDIYEDALSGFIDTLESAYGRIKDTEKSLRGYAETKSVSDYFNSMENTKKLLQSGNYDEFNKSLADTIELTSVLKDSNNFETEREMQFNQIVAANQFGDLGVDVTSEMDVLKEIATDTSKSYQVQQDTLNIQKQQAEEIRKMRKEIRDLREEMAS